VGLLVDVDKSWRITTVFDIHSVLLSMMAACPSGSRPCMGKVGAKVAKLGEKK